MEAMCITHFPAAKMLLEFAELTSSAVTGPGISAPDPTDAHDKFEKLNCATLASVLSESAMVPAATSNSSLSC